MTAPVHIAASGAAQPVFTTTRKEPPVPHHIVQSTRPGIDHETLDAHLRNARPRPRAPAGTAVVIALAWAVGFALGALVAAVAGWL